VVAGCRVLAATWLVACAGFVLAACANDGRVEPTPEFASQAWPLWGGETDTTHKGVIMVGNSRQPPSCSATLIAPNLVITAQHCVAQITNTQDMNVCKHQFGAPHDRPYALFGDSLFGPYEIILASEVVVPQNCTSTCGCDVALLILENNVPDPSIAIDVQTKRQPFEGQAFDLVAFGTTNQMGAGFGVRRRRSVSVECFSWACGAGLSTNEFVATSAGCEGDSGGPGIDDEGKLLGVISRTSFPCDSPDALNIYTSVQWTLDLITETARRAASEGGYEVPEWAAPPVASVCETAGFCGAHAEADGTMVDCGQCTAPEVCGADGTCTAPIAMGGVAGMGGGPIDDMFQGVWCRGVVCPMGWVCAGNPQTCAMPCDPNAPVCDEGTSCDAVAGACLLPGLASPDGGVAAASTKPDDGGCSIAGAPGAGASHASGSGATAPTALLGLAAGVWLGRRRIGRRSRATTFVGVGG
jgi:hypothetical protein